MIRLRSAFLIVIVGCAAAYFIGFMNGYLMAGNIRTASGIMGWIDEVTALSNISSSVLSSDPASSEAWQKSVDIPGFFDGQTPGSANFGPDTQ
jgi:hypothetical protein